ncbi:MAG: hypothetical protein AABW56_01405 [Nanoarchaeota archaeon]
MRVCPKCKKRELDVTDKPNNYRCWNCGYFCIGTKYLDKED